jgi:replication factor A1
MFYPACAADNCNKKVIARENDWFCESCNRSFPNPRYRYTLSANVADHTGQLWISIFDAVGSELLQKSADQIHSIGVNYKNNLLYLIFLTNL